jgi:hypothetical protein
MLLDKLKVMEFLNENNMEDEFLSSVNLLKQLQEYIKQKRDDRVKEVGDRVLIWDGSYNMDKNTNKSRSGFDKLFLKPGIVIQTNCEFIYVEKLLDDMTVNLDLLIKFESGEEIYTQSAMVKRIDDDKV